MNADGLMADAFQSIRLSKLENLFESIFKEMQSSVEEQRSQVNLNYTSEHLKDYIRERKILLTQRYSEEFCDETPDIAVTYLWRGTSLRNLVSVLKGEFPGDPLIWLDIVFNDQRSEQQASCAVRKANVTYVRARKHVVIFSKAEYPASNTGMGPGDGVKWSLCDPWDRCWCILELAVRELACRKKNKEQSILILSPDYLSEVREKILQPGTSVEDSVRGMLHGRDFCANMQGKPADVCAIRDIVTSADFFGSAAALNSYLEDLLIKVFIKHLSS